MIDNNVKVQKIVKKKIAVKNSERYVPNTFGLNNRTKFFTENVLKYENQEEYQENSFKDKIEESQTLNQTPKNNKRKKNLKGYECNDSRSRSCSVKRNKCKDDRFKEEKLLNVKERGKDNVLKEKKGNGNKNVTNFGGTGYIVNCLIANREKKEQIYDKENFNPNIKIESNDALRTSGESMSKKNIMTNEKIRFVDSHEKTFFSHLTGNVNIESEEEFLNLNPKKPHKAEIHPLSSKKLSKNYLNTNSSNNLPLKEINKHFSSIHSLNQEEMIRNNSQELINLNQNFDSMKAMSHTSEADNIGGGT